MVVIPSSYEVTSINSLVNGDMFVLNATAYTVIHKKFDEIELFNHRKNYREIWNLPIIQTVTRVKGGTLSV